MMKKEIGIEIICTLLVILFLYSSFSKYFDFYAFKRAMYNQPFPVWLSTFLIWTLPSMEAIISLIIIYNSTRLWGLYAFTIVMISFTFYVAAILLHFFPRVPCACGGFMKLLSWTQHLLLNIFFVILSYAGIRLKAGSNKWITYKRLKTA